MEPRPKVDDADGDRPEATHGDAHVSHTTAASRGCKRSLFSNSNSVYSISTRKPVERAKHDNDHEVLFDAFFMNCLDMHPQMNSVPDSVVARLPVDTPESFERKRRNLQARLSCNIARHEKPPD